MNHLRTLIMFILVCFATTDYAQQTGTTTGSQKPKVIRITPAKPDTGASGQKTMKKLSRDSMYNVSDPTAGKAPQDAQAVVYFNNGFTKAKNGDYSGAIEDFTKSLDLVKNVNVYLKRGSAYMIIGKYPQAINDATEVIKLKPSILDAYFIRGVCRFETREYVTSREDLTYFVARDKTNPAAFNYLAALFFMNKEYTEALQQYSEVIKLNPQFPDAYTNRGMMFHYKQDYFSAIQDYNEALKLNPQNVTAYNNRGAARLMLKDFKGSIEDFTQAIALDSNNANAYDNRGRAKHALGDTLGACQDWRTALLRGLKASQDLISEFCE